MAGWKGNVAKLNQAGLELNWARQQQWKQELGLDCHTLWTLCEVHGLLKYSVPTSFMGIIMVVGMRLRI